MPTAIVVSVVVGVLTLAVGVLVGQALRARKEKALGEAASADAERLIAEADVRPVHQDRLATLIEYQWATFRL